MTESQGFLKLSIKTWSRDSHGLFDYESSQIKPHQGNITDHAILIRKKMDIKLTKSLSDLREEEFLFEIKTDNKSKIFFF